MKSKTKVSILFALVIIFLFSSIFNTRFSKNIIANSNYLEFTEKDQVQIKQSGFWNLTGNPIYIDDLTMGVGAHNWTWAETQPWCSGSGSWTDPYVIENVTIDGQGSGNCVEIINSDDYFIIRNCTVYNSGFSSNNAGIKLYNIDNGKIMNNNCSDNNYNGIYLRASNNNTLSGNTANFNNDSGIHLDWYNDNNTLLGNTANNNKNGIHLYDSNNNTLSGNIVNNNNDGINLSTSDNNTISGNNANNNDNGMYLWFSEDNTLSENNASNNNNHGIDLYYCVNNILSGNNASKNITGISLSSSDNNTLSGNTANNINYGIVLGSSDNNALSGNTASNNNEVGITIYDGSHNNTLFGNILNNNTNGIWIWNSDNNTLSGNTINNNSYGILLDSNSNSNKLFLNHFTNNEIDAEDNGINNKWDNGTIGNYWDDYDGVDANDDGIGDTSYLISGTAGSQDNFPIWTDGDEEIPEVPIISFGNYYVLFTFATILSFIIMEKQKKK